MDVTNNKNIYYDSAVFQVIANTYEFIQDLNIKLRDMIPEMDYFPIIKTFIEYILDKINGIGKCVVK